MKLSDNVNDAHALTHLTLEVPSAVKGFALPSGRAFWRRRRSNFGRAAADARTTAQQNNRSVPTTGRSLRRQISRMRCSTELPQATLTQLRTINMENGGASGAKVPHVDISVVNQRC